MGSARRPLRRRFAPLLAVLLGLGLVAPVRALDAETGMAVMAAIGSGETETALGLLMEALVTAERPEDREDVLVQLARLQQQLGRLEEAGEAWLEIAASMERRLGRSASERASALEQAGELFWQAGAVEKAVRAQVAAIEADMRRGLPGSRIPLYARLEQRIGALPQLSTRLTLLQRFYALDDVSAARRDPLGAASSPLSAGQPAGGSSPLSAGSAGPAGGGVPGDSASLPPGDDTRPPHSTIRIYYATDRARQDGARPSEIYGAGRGPLDYGSADVSIPLVHRPGELEAPSIWSFDTVEDPERHVILTAVSPAPREEVFRQMQRHLFLTGSDEAFVFVHGFNVTFADAAKRTAQIAYDMNFDGLPILYSWPSAGNLFSYMADSAVVQLSGRRLSAFLDEVVRDTGAKRIHLVAHSMGNRALIEALELFALRHAGEPPAFDQALFTAPDIDAGLFAAMAETVRPAVRRMTLYTSQKDWALMASRKLHGDAPRAGEGGPGTPIPGWVDSIDMSTLGEDMLAHSYFANDASALSDILTLFWRDTPPEKRCGMAAGQPGETAAAWRYDPLRCDGSAMLSALAQLRSARIGSVGEAMALIERKFLPPEIELDRKLRLENAVTQLLGR